MKDVNSSRVCCAYSGKKGAYAQQAIDRHFAGKNVEAVPMDSFDRVFRAVTEGSVEYGMIPIENSLNGSVYQNYDNFSKFQAVEIIGSVSLNIRHCLLVKKGTGIGDIKNVYSHPQALGQCHKFLLEHSDWELMDAVSTATAAEFVSRSQANCSAAIGSDVNAELYGLDILARDIEDDPMNFTRFVIISSKKGNFESVKGANTASVVFTTKNESGALYHVLSVFNDLHLNLSRLSSRPIKGQLWKSWFYADVEMNENCSPEFVEKFMDEMKNKTEEVRLLGVYFDADIKA